MFLYDTPGNLKCRPFRGVCFGLKEETYPYRLAYGRRDEGSNKSCRNVPRSQCESRISEFFVIEAFSFGSPPHPPHIPSRIAMAKATKRTLEDTGEGTSPKKIKLTPKPEKKRKSKADQVPAQTSPGPNEEVDFPRGGGTSFTPVEIKTIRAEAQHEANEDIFKARFNHMC